MNEIIRLENRIFELACGESAEGAALEDPENHKIPEIDYDEVDLLFAAFAKFKERPDYREHFRTWYTGGDLSELPPPPEPPAKEEAAAEDAPGEYPEGAQIYGGDEDGSQIGNGTEEADTERAEGAVEDQDQVPALRGQEDSPENHPGQHEEGDVVRELQP
jgi:hypothetical protein